MGLKIFIDSLDDVHEDIRDSYVADGDRFKLNFDLIKDHEGVTKIRKTANDLDKKAKDAAKALTELQEKFGDLDPEAAREALKAIEDAGDKEMLDDGKVDELVEKRVSAARTDFDKQLEAKDARIAELETGSVSLTGELASIKIYDAVKDAALAKGARKEALADIANRAKGVWSLVDGEPKAMDGEEAVYGKSGEALTINEWVETLAADSAHLFEANSGGGAQGGDKGGNQGGVSQVSLAAAGDNIAKIAGGDVTVDRGQ